MSKARLIITAVVVEGRSQADVARDYGVSASWVSRLVARYRAEGETAFAPRSRRPKASPRRLDPETVELIVKLRRELVANGLDAGTDTIAWHLSHHHRISVSVSTIHRYLRRERPKSSYVRFQAEQPNECWQADMTHWRLADGTDSEILGWLDDHSRLALSLRAELRVSGSMVVAAFRAAVDEYGPPAATLTDNGMIFTTRFSGGRGGLNGFETELARLHITQKNSRPNHPTTCGKVERFHQTLKRWLGAQRRAETIAELQDQLDQFKDIYNRTRPHRSLPGRATPAVAYQARPKATPDPQTALRGHHRVRHDVVDYAGKLTLRYNGRLHHIGLGRRFARTRVLMLVADLDVRVVDAATGELIRHLTLDPAKDYHGTGRPKGRPGPRSAPPNPE